MPTPATPQSGCWRFAAQSIGRLASMPTETIEEDMANILLK